MGKRNNSFSAKVVIDIQNGTMYEKTSKEEFLYSIDKVLNDFVGALNISLNGITEHEFRQILAIVHGKSEPIALSIKQDCSIEDFFADDNDEE